MREPHVSGTPRTQMLSLIATGTPAKAPRVSPRFRRASISVAAATIDSGSKWR